MTRAGEEFDRLKDRIRYLDDVIEEGRLFGLGAAQVSRAIQVRASVEREIDDLGAHVVDGELIPSLLKLLRELKRGAPERLAPKMSDDETTAFAKSNRTLERERVAANLEQLLEDHGIETREEV